MSNKNLNKTTRAELIRKVQAGLSKHFPKGTLVLAGTSYTPAALQKLLQGDIDASDASTQARAQWLDAVKVAHSTAASIDPVLRAISAQVQSQHGEAANAETVLADFGYTPRRKVIKTVAVKAAAAAKSLATREARHTMGPRQKAKVVGVVPSADAPPATASVVASPPAVTDAATDPPHR
jgi:hypothetical protein